MKVLIINNIPSPYRTKLYIYLQQNYTNMKLYTLYTNYNENDREWSIDSIEKNRTVLSSKVFTIKGNENAGTATKFIHLPKKLYKTINKIDPDIIIAGEYNISAVSALIWCKCRRRKFINLTDGTLHSEGSINPIQKLLRKVVINYSDAYIASGTRAREKLKKWGAADKAIFTSFLTVDITPLLSIKRNVKKNRILFVGRISREKGLDLLIEALKYVESDFELHIVGNDVNNERMKVENIIRINDLKEKITFCGFKCGKDLLREYEQAEILIVPSRSDCFGLVMVEALSAGIPFIASKYADGAIDVIQDDFGGMIIDPFNSFEFARVIDECLSGKRKIKVNRELARKFAFEEVAIGYRNAISYVKEENGI